LVSSCDTAHMLSKLSYAPKKLRMHLVLAYN
jgi:hypothetical protein